MRPKDIRRLLERQLGYVVVRSAGSHHRLKAPNRPPVTLAIHAKEFGPSLVRDILVKQVGLSLVEALEVYERGA